MNTEAVKIKQIKFEETYPIRQIVLRPNRPLETCFFQGDQLETTVHFGLFYKDELAGVISLFKSNSSLFSVETQYQIRGMAVLPEYQKFGFGKRLVEHSEVFLSKQKTNFIWFNAREVAVDFYKKQGYILIGDAFDIPDVGVHYVMYKSL